MKIRKAIQNVENGVVWGRLAHATSLEIVPFNRAQIPISLP